MSQRRRIDPKKNLCHELAGAIKVIQEDHVLIKQVKGGHFAADQLCDLVEAVFLHELNDKRGILWRDKQSIATMDLPEASFWACIEPLVSDEIKMQVLALRDSDSDVKKCRAWIRLMLTKGMLLSFLNDVQKHPRILGPHYGSEALLRDPECSEIIIQLLKGLQVFEFEYDFTNPRLIAWEARVLQLAGIWTQIEPKAAPRDKHKVHSSTYGRDERVSPPPSDFLMDDVVVSPALDKYSTWKSSRTDLSDDQLIEIEEHQDTLKTEIPFRAKSTSVPDRPVTSDFSYNAMLQSYARKVDKPLYTGSVDAIVEDDTCSSYENIEASDVHVKDSNLQLAQDMNFEVVSADDYISPGIRTHIQTLTAILTSLECEKGLDSQEYQCASCKRPIGIIFGQAKLCKFDGFHYCYECHLDDERSVPARILFNWDFRKHRVCVRSCEFLDSIEVSPILNLEDINKALYQYIPELEQAKKLRQHLAFLKDYIFTCKDTSVAEEFKKKIRSAHFYENIHLYSVKDLKQIYCGSLLQRLKKIVKNATRHIRNCSICSQKGFICEVCQKDEVLFPFDDETFQCTDCKSVYHSTCRSQLKAGCPKCIRLEQRRASHVKYQTDN